MHHKPPSLNEWERLYGLAKSLWELQPWTYMEETDIFGVSDPASGVIGFCCVIGSLGEALGLIIYRGKAGLESYRKLRKNRNYEKMIDLQDCLSILFVENDKLQPEDIEVMERIGIKTRHPGIYPLFRDHIPFYIPWFLTQKEASFLLCILDEAINMCSRFKDNKTMLKPPKKGQLLVRVPVKTTNGIAWEDRWISSEDIPAERGSDFVIDEVAMRRIKKKGKFTDMIWEVGYFYITDLIVNDPDKNRPCIPLHLLIVDKESRFIFGNALTTPLSFYQNSFNSLMKSFETHGLIPEKIHIKDPELLIILDPLKAELGISVRIVKSINSFEFAKRTLLKFLRRKGPFLNTSNGQTDQDE